MNTYENIVREALVKWHNVIESTDLLRSQGD